MRKIRRYMKEEKEFYSTIVKSETHPSHYLIHKYWSRKPHNIIANYISQFTKENDVVLDPFMGSGVTIIESLKLKRHPIGVDINPISTFLVNSITEKIDLNEIKNSFKEIEENFTKFEKEYFYTLCPICNKDSLVVNNLFYENVKCDFCGEINTIRDCKRKGSQYKCKTCGENLRRVNGNIKYQLKKIKGICTSCGNFIKEPDKNDELLINKIHEEFIESINLGTFWAPQEKILKSIKRSGKERLYELFSERNLIGINLIRDRINNIHSKKIRDILLLTLTSSISSASRMIPVNEKTITGKSGWQIPKYYIFPTHLEKNIFEAFKDRFNRNIKGLKELKNYNFNKPQLYNKSSKDLSFIKSDSVDFIFTDPPYGGTIQYLALSEIWNSLINKKANFKEEIVVDKDRKKNLENYESDLTESFRECSRVLKRGKIMTLTFNARDIKVFNALINSCLNAGFSLEYVSHQESAVSSATQGLNWKTTLRGDFILLFKNKKIPQHIQKDYNNNLDFQIIEIIKRILKKEDTLEFAAIFSLILPEIISLGYLNNDLFSSIDIYSLLEDNFNKKIEDSKILWSLK